jgi:hypothetical protein
MKELHHSRHFIGVEKIDRIEKTQNIPAADTPALKGEAWPPFSLKLAMTRSPNREMTSRELSVDPSSTTSTSVEGFEG